MKKEQNKKSKNENENEKQKSRIPPPKKKEKKRKEPRKTCSLLQSAPMKWGNQGLQNGLSRAVALGEACIRGPQCPPRGLMQDCQFERLHLGG